jgi:ribosome maturation protein Sdo1
VDWNVHELRKSACAASPEHLRNKMRHEKHKRVHSEWRASNVNYGTYSVDINYPKVETKRKHHHPNPSVRKAIEEAGLNNILSTTSDRGPPAFNNRP